MAIRKIINLLTSASITASADAAAVAVPMEYSKWVVTTSLGTVTGTSPTLDITIQQSADGTNWITLIAVTQRVAGSASTVLHTFAAAATDYLKPMLPYMRASYVIGGTSTPTFNTVSVNLHVE